jgi:MFS family permease
LPVPVGRREPDDVASETEFLQLHTPVIAATAWAFTLIRAAVGFFAFGIAFALRRDSEPAFMYGAAAMAWAVGAFGGNVVAPALRQRSSEDRLTAGSLIALAVVAAFGALGPSRLLVIVVALVLGLAASIGRQGFDALVQSRAPHSRRGIAFARFETRFQFGWVTGAIAATAIAAPIRVSMAVVAGGLVPAALFYLRNMAEVHQADADDPSRPVVLVRRRLERLTSADHQDQQRFIAVELGGAADVLRAMRQPIGAELVGRVESLRRSVLAGHEPDRELLGRALHDMLAAVARLDTGDVTARRGQRATSR